MSNFFSIESPLFQWLSKFADRMFLNVLFVVSCVPLITIGTATVALYDVTRRIRNDEGHVWNSYWKAFRSNFKQATLIWLVLLLSGLLIAFSASFYFGSSQTGSTLGILIVSIVFFLWAITTAWAFPLQARFKNSVRNTLINSLICGVVCFLRSIAVAFINSIPLLIFLFLPVMFLYLSFIWVLVWFSFAASINLCIIKKRFAELEKLSANNSQPLVLESNS